jgi:hypothetical protein
MVNFGVVKNHLSRSLSEHYISNNDGSAEKSFLEFINIVKKSPVLMLEYIVFKNLERGNLFREEAVKYIDDNICLFNNYDKKDIIRENEKLRKFNVENPFNTEYPLMESIQALILESANRKSIPNVNKIHSSFSFIMESMCRTIEDKNEMDGSEMDDNEDTFTLNEVIAVADKRMNDQLGELSEDEKSIVSTLYSDNETAQEELLESFKSKALAILDTQGDSQMIAEAQEKVKNISYNKNTVLDNIIALYELIQ